MGRVLVGMRPRPCAGLMPPARARYTADFRARAAAHAREWLALGPALTAVARELGIAQGGVRRSRRHATFIPLGITTTPPGVTWKRRLSSSAS